MDDFELVKLVTISANSDSSNCSCFEHAVIVSISNSGASVRIAPIIEEESSPPDKHDPILTSARILNLTESKKSLLNSWTLFSLL